MHKVTKPSQYIQGTLVTHPLFILFYFITFPKLSLLNFMTEKGAIHFAVFPIDSEDTLCQVPTVTLCILDNNVN